MRFHDVCDHLDHPYRVRLGHVVGSSCNAPIRVVLQRPEGGRLPQVGGASVGCAAIRRDLSNVCGSYLDGRSEVEPDDITRTRGVARHRVTVANPPTVIVTCVDEEFGTRSLDKSWATAARDSNSLLMSDGDMSPTSVRCDTAISRLWTQAYVLV